MQDRQFMVCDAKIMVVHAPTPHDAIKKIEQGYIEEIYDSALSLEHKFQEITVTPLTNVFEIN